MVNQPRKIFRDLKETCLVAKEELTTMQVYLKAQAYRPASFQSKRYIKNQFSSGPSSWESLELRTNMAT